MVSIALEDTAYGTLVEGYESWDGFHTLQSGDTLVNISSDGTSDPASGLIVKFVADGTAPADSAVARIHVIKTGEGYSTFFVPPEAMTHQGKQVLQATAEVTVVGNAVKLAILQPTDNSDNGHITHEPKMPTVTCQAQLQNYSGGRVTYKWMYSTADTFLQKTLDGYPLLPRYSGIGFFGSTSTSGSNISQWPVPFNGLFTGGKTLLIVNAATIEGETYSDTVYANSIVGDNPLNSAEVKNGLSLEEQVLVYMESHPKWKQFNESTIDDYNLKGNPIYGPPHGFGLMQIDNPPASAAQLWNWKDNLSAGTSLFAEKKATALAHPAKVRKKGAAYSNATDFSSEQMLTEAFQLYNGGYYWVWVPKDPRAGGGSWQKRTNLLRDYGGQAKKYYDGVVNGNPPSNW